jgi:(1->4)-alpha-D-glucan 1-alpha-D-glucosylmutase
VTDHTTLDPELGSEVEFEGLTRALKGHGMGLLIDVVPNHRGIMDASNLWWQEVLEDGPSSHCAHFFDFDWVPPKENVAHKILLPILGDQYDLVLEDGDLQLCYEGGAFFITYCDRRSPVDLKNLYSYPQPGPRESVVRSRSR